MESSRLNAALACLFASGPLEVYEDGALLPLTDPQCLVQEHGGRTLVHLWSEDGNLVRSVVGVAAEADGRLVLEVQRFGRRCSGKLELIHRDLQPRKAYAARRKFLARLAQLLAEQFADERVESLSSAADLEHSLSGSYVRGIQSRGQHAWAIMAASDHEDAETVDGILSYSLLWLARAQRHSSRRTVEGLRLFLPAGKARVTVQRLQAIRDDVRVEVFELNEAEQRLRPVDAADVGNVATRLTPRHEAERALDSARPWVERVQQLLPGEIAAVVPPGAREVALRLRGLEFARWRNGRLYFGLFDQQEELVEGKWATFKKWLQDLNAHRQPVAKDRNHPVYRAQAERWLESQVLSSPTAMDARLDGDQIYSQVPALTGGDRGIIDLLGVTRDGRLVVIELKVTEHIHLPLQAVDYWLRVRLHQQQDDFRRFGYFEGVELQDKPPLLYLVAPALRFHPTTDTILGFLSPEVEIIRIGVNENWRAGLQVVLRM